MTSTFKTLYHKKKTYPDTLMVTFDVMDGRAYMQMYTQTHKVDTC